MTHAVLIREPDTLGRKTPPPEPRAEGKGPPPETARIAGDLMEMMRVVCFRTRDTRGKRLKIAQLIDNILRPAVVKMFNKSQEEDE